MKSFINVILVGATSVFVAACSGGKNQTTIEVVQGMMDQISMKSQDYDPDRKEASNRVPPENTVPRGKDVYRYSGDPMGAEANLRNPLAGATEDEWLNKGAEKFRIYCSVCHGAAGKGDGTVAEKMTLKPPSLLSDKVRNFKDGRIFHIITDGQGVMGSYATQIYSAGDRWAIVNYIRKLQKDDGAK